MNSELLNNIIQYLRDHLEPYKDDVFYYEDAFLRASEDNEHIYMEYADTKEDADSNVFDDGDSYEKTLGLEQIISFIAEEYHIGRRIKKNLMPFREINGGKESIFEHIVEGYTVPDKVIRYLQIKKPEVVCMGLYKHPFKPDLTLCGPYWYSDDIWMWDRDAW